MNEREVEEALSLISPWRGPNGERFLVVSAPTVSLRWLEPGYGTGGSIWRLQALKSGNTVEISTDFITWGVSRDEADILAVLSLFVGVSMSRQACR